jgi:alkylation response protein AidB-like acyl-CoA dehydrogenase
MTMLILTEDQRLLQDSIRALLEAEAPIARFRALRDAGERQDRALWDRMIEGGFPGIPFSEEDGGMGWGLAEVAVVMEELGRTLALTPMLSVVLGGLLDPEAGAAGGAVVALAWQSSDSLDRSAVKARVTEGRLHGRKLHVLDAGAATSFVVTAREGDELGLFRVRAEDASVAPLHRADCRDAGHVSFESAPAQRLEAGGAELERAVEAATVALAAEMVGGAQAAMAATVAYLKERVQFDAPIGSFQALQHRAVDMYMAVELARAAVIGAARDPRPELVSLAKASANDAYLHVAKEAIQLHGGIGMTDEHDIGFHLKRALVASRTLGTSAWHRDRWARVGGY